MFDDIVLKYSQEFDVPAPWIQAVIMKESSGNPRAYRAEPRINDASYGLMQLLFKTARGLGYLGAPEGLYDPDTNIKLGTKLLSQLRTRFGDDVAAVYSAYNSGSGTAYLSNADVKLHVDQFLADLQAVIAGNPLLAGSGGLALVVAALMILFWRKKK